MEIEFSFLVSLWKNYNNASSILTKAIGGTANEVGEFAELLAGKYFLAEQLSASNKSADLITKDGKLIQVKSRKVDYLKSTFLDVIRSWDFDILVVILFSKDGNIIKAIHIEADIAKSLSKENKHQNGYILTTSNELLGHNKSTDITNELQNILNSNMVEKYDSNKDKIKIKEKQNKVIDKIIKNNVSDKIIIKNITIRDFDSKDEILQDYIKRVLHILFDNNLIPKAEISNLQDINYCKRTFYLFYPLLEIDKNKLNDDNDLPRYWKKELFGKKYYGCKEWWKQNVEIYYVKFNKWLKYLAEINA